jgi:hypothetical protein
MIAILAGLQYQDLLVVRIHHYDESRSEPGLAVKLSLLQAM